MIKITQKLFNIFESRQQHQIFLLGIMMLIGGIMESLSVSLMLPVITAIMNSDTWNEATYVQAVCNIFHITDQRTYVELLLIALIAIFILKNVYLLFMYRVQYTFITKNRIRLQRKLMHSFMQKPYAFYLQASTGEIIRIVVNDTTDTFSLLSTVLGFYTELIVAIVLGITIFALSPIIGISMVVILLIEVVVIAWIVKPILKNRGDNQRIESAASNKWMLQSINGIKSIKVANRQVFFEEKYGVHADRGAIYERSFNIWSQVPRLTIEAFTITGVIFMLLVFVIAGVDLATLIPQLSAFVVAAVRLLPSANRISTSVNQVPYYEGALDNLITTMASEKEAEVIAENQVSNSATLQRIIFDHDLVFNEVTFTYPDGVSPVLDHANMQILPGQSIGVVGTSGAGKTTAIDIMLGLLMPQSGQVLVDGVDIHDNINGWRKLLGYIPQSIFLMDDTIRENVAFGMHSDQIDDEQVWRALRDAQLEDMVRALPEQLDAKIGEAGVRISGGQRQRLGIARALYNNPDILFFDEATSALDNETEAAIMESIDNLKGRKTLVIIAHRLSTIENCDVVYRVGNGKIVREK